MAGGQQNSWPRHQSGPAGCSTGTLIRSWTGVGEQPEGLILFDESSFKELGSNEKSFLRILAKALLPHLGTTTIGCAGGLGIMKGRSSCHGLICSLVASI